MIFSAGKCKADTQYTVRMWAYTGSLVPIMFGFAHGQIYIELAPHSFSYKTRQILSVRHNYVKPLVDLSRKNPVRYKERIWDTYCVKVPKRYLKPNYILWIAWMVVGMGMSYTITLYMSHIDCVCKVSQILAVVWQSESLFLCFHGQHQQGHVQLRGLFMVFRLRYHGKQNVIKYSCYISMIIVNMLVKSFY